MMTKAGLTALIAAGLCFGAVACTTSFETEPTNQSGDELSADGKQPASVKAAAPAPTPSASTGAPPSLGGDPDLFVGAWESSSGPISTLVFETTVDGAGHHFFAHETTPSASALAPRPEGYFTVTRDFVVLYAKGEPSHAYRYTVEKDALTLSDGMTIQNFKRADSYCDAPADCDAQGLVHVMCAGNYVCEKTHTCQFICGNPAKTN